MATVEDRLRPQLDQARKAVEDTSGLDAAALGDAGRAAIDRFTFLLDRIEQLAVAADEALMSDSMVNSVVTAMTQGTASLVQGAAGQPEVIATTLPVASEQILNSLAVWPLKVGTKAEISKIGATYAESFTQRLGQVDQRLADLQKEVEKIAADLQTSEQQGAASRDQAVAALTAQLNVVKEGADRLALEIEQQKVRVDGIATEFQKQFTQAQEQRAEAAQAQLQEQATAAQGRATAADTAYKAAATNLQNQGKTVIDQMQEMRVQAQELMHAITATGTAAGYQNEGDAERSRADIFGGLAVVVALLAALASFLLLEVLASGKSQPIQNIIARILVVFIVGGVASYLAAQSAHHRRREVAARKKQLALVALEPFISGLPEAEKAGPRQILAAGLFDVADSGREDQEASLTDSNITVLQRVLDIVTKFGGSH